jgi:hypothetical protein
MSDTRPSLVVHIGGAKCGSTSIQECLRVNRQVLAQHGVIVPDTNFEFATGLVGPIWYVEQLATHENPGDKLVDDLEALCADFTEKTKNCPSSIIFSAENLSNHDPARMFGKIREKFKLHIVLYIRRQEDAYQAAWLQWFVKEEWKLEDWVKSSDGYFCDWDKVVSRWAALAPEKMSIQILERELLVGGDVVEDFCSLLFPAGISLLPSRKDLNSSFGVHVADLFASLPGMFTSIHDIAFDDVLYGYELTSVKKRPNEWIFDRAQLDIIRQRHAAGNARLKQVYFDNLERAELFPPVPEDAVTGLSQEEINRRNIAVVAELLVKHILRSRHK